MTATFLPYARATSHFLAVLAILWVGAANLFAGTIVGAPRDVTGTTYSGPVSQVSLKPLGTPQTIGTNVYWPFEATASITNNFFSSPLIQGFYWASPVIANPFVATPRVLIYMPDSDTNNIWQFNDCANIAARLRTYVSSNAYVQMTNFPASAITNAPWLTNNATGVTLSGTFSGDGTGLQLVNSATNGITNSVTYTMSFTSTNPIDAYAPSVGSEVNGRYYWNSALNRYTNAALPYFIANQNEFTGGWYIGTNLSDPDGTANKWYYNGSVSMPIYESSAWAYGDANGSSAIIWLGTITATNSNLSVQKSGITITVPEIGWTAATALSLNNIFGEQMFAERIFYGGLCRFGTRYSYVYPSFDFVPNTSSGTGNDGLQAYAWNLASSQLSGDDRFSIGASFLHGTNGQNGATFDFLNLFRSGYSTANNSGGFKIYMRFGTRGDTTVGDIPYSQHGSEPVASWRFGIYGGNGDGIMPNFGMGSGNMVAAPVAGGKEFDGTNWYGTDNSAVRKRQLWVKTSANNIPAAITVGASPFAYTNATGTPLVFWHYGTNNYSIALNGVTVQSFNGTNGANMILAPTNRVVITYTAAPILNTNLFQF